MEKWSLGGAGGVVVVSRLLGAGWWHPPCTRCRFQRDQISRVWPRFALRSLWGVVSPHRIVPWAWRPGGGVPAPSFLFLLATFQGVVPDVSGYRSG